MIEGCSPIYFLLGWYLDIRENDNRDDFRRRLGLGQRRVRIEGDGAPRESRADPEVFSP
jgi:hypothetical protein